MKKSTPVKKTKKWQAYKIFPILSHPEKFDRSLFIHKPFVKSQKLVPLIAYIKVKENQEEAEWIPWEEIQKSKEQLIELDRYARHCLMHRDLRFGWKPFLIPFFDTEVTVMLLQGDMTASSELLTSDTLDILTNYFQSETVIVGIPSAMCAVAASKSEHLHQILDRLYWESPEEWRLPLQMYYYKNHKIVRIQTPEPPPKEPKVSQRDKHLRIVFPIEYYSDFAYLYRLIQYLLHQFLPQINPQHFLLIDCIFHIQQQDESSLTDVQIQYLNELFSILKKQIQEKLPDFRIKPFNLSLKIEPLGEDK